MTTTAVLEQPATSSGAGAAARADRAAAEAARLVRACLSPWESSPDAPLRRLIEVALDGLGSSVALRNAFVDSLNEQIDRVAPALPPKARRMVFGAQLAVLVNRHILHLGPFAEAPFERVADQVAGQIAFYMD